jgi:hypothetical protein
MPLQPEPFSRRCGQQGCVDLPETLRRSVLYLIQDTFEDDIYSLTPTQLIDAALASEKQQQPLAALFASRNLHDVTVRQEGLAPSSDRDTWLDVYILGCTTAKFLDIVEYMLRDRWRGSRSWIRAVNARLQEHGLPYEIRRGRVRALQDARPAEVGGPIELTPWTPHRNRELFCGVLCSCRRRIWWWERHMPKEALELLYMAFSSSDPPAVTDIRLMSGHQNIDTTCTSCFSTFAAEMHIKGINVEWRVLRKSNANQVHDRYVITEGAAYNVPPVNSVFVASQMTEIAVSSMDDSHFDAFWTKGVDIESWDIGAERRAARRRLR